MTHRLQPGRIPIGVIGLILAAWVLLALIDVSPYAELLSHHVIGDRTLSLNQSLALFQTGWFLMNVAMMLPGVLPALAQLPQNDDVFWIIGYLMVWLDAGLLVYGGDLAVHTLLEPQFPLATLWLPTAVLFIAGVYQFTPWKHYALSACRKSFGNARYRRTAVAHGWLHGLACVGSCWALTLVMASWGNMNLAYMLLLGAFMAAEKNPCGARKLTYPLGAALVGAAGVVTLRTLGAV